MISVEETNAYTIISKQMDNPNESKCSNISLLVKAGVDQKMYILIQSRIMVQKSSRQV